MLFVSSECAVGGTGANAALGFERWVKQAYVKGRTYLRLDVAISLARDLHHR